MALVPRRTIGWSGAASEPAPCSARAVLNRYERGQFIEVAYGKRDEVSAQFLSELGCGPQMLNGLSQLGAKIDFSDKIAGYALITIPRDKLLQTLDIEGIAYAYTRNDDRLYYQDPVAKIPQDQRKPQPVPPITIPYPRVASALPKDGPYFAADEIGLTELWKQHPEADGRGVKVAVPDEGFDLLHPALQQARNGDGHLVAKIADLGTLTTPNEDSGWVQFGEPIQSREGLLEAAGRTWTVPEDGAYRFGIFKQELVLGPEDNSLSKKLSLSVGVLWDEPGSRVWVDTDGDGSFKNQRTLGDYGGTHDVDWFGEKQGDDDNRIPFGLKIDAAKKAIYIRIGGEHGAFVGGPLAGNRLTGGVFDGTSPSAQLVDSASYRATYLADMVRMFARPDVDVINRSGGIGRAGYTGNREGIEDFAQHVLERVTTVYDKPIACYSAAVGTIHVNDFAGAEMLRRNRQVGPPYKDTINSFVWWLPDGLVNTVLAPSANLETDSRYKPQDITWPDGKRHNFSDTRFNPPAPDGYVIGANNSPTIPVVSGLLADLISEAKREHVRYNAERLNNAVFTGTRLLNGIPPSQQGYGLINAAQSWNQLAMMAKADDPNNPELAGFAFSRMETGRTTPVRGFQADLPKAGQSFSGAILVTRRGGYAGARKYTFALRGNDGSFTLLDHAATLVSDQATPVRFRNNGVSGWHLAFLQLRDAKADVVMQEVPLSVRVPDVPTHVAAGVDRYQSTIPPLSTELRYVRVDQDAQAARYVMRIPYTGPENISTRGIPGGRYGTTNTPAGEPVDAAHHVGPMETLESLVVNDEPGTQVIFWENRGRPEYATQDDGPAPDVPIQAELKVLKYAVAISKSAGGTLRVNNELAEIQGKVELYDAKLADSTLHGQSGPVSAELAKTLPAGAAQWRVAVSSDHPGEPADVYLLDCTAKEGCYVAAQQPICANPTALVLDKPQSGEWKILVRERKATASPSKYHVREALLTPVTARIDPGDNTHPSGSIWTLPLPSTKSDAHYAAFRIAGTPGDKRQKDGLTIGMTPLTGDAP